MEYMSPREFLKNLSILCVFAFILTAVGYGTFVYADKYVWTYLGSPTTNWQAVIMTNSTYGYAARDGVLYVTTTAGDTWNPQYNFGSQYIIRSIAASENGNYVLVSLDDLAGDATFSVSNSYGSSFSSPAPFAADFQGVAMSEGGQYMYVADYGGARVLYSNDFGNAWNYSNVSYNPVSVATSNDGRFVYVASHNGYFSRSEDFGVNYSGVSSGVTSGNYIDVAASADGQHVYILPTLGFPLHSADYGQNFSILASAGSRAWKSVSVSGDGSRVVLVDESGSSSQVYSSRDYGANFTIENTVGTSRWNDVSLSSDGYTTLLASSDSYVWMGSRDTVLPIITNVYSLSGNGTYKAGQTVQLQINFSEPVYTSTLDLTLETGSTDRVCQTGSIVAGATSATCTYTVQIGDVTSDLSTNAIANTLMDDAGNPRTDHSGALAFLAANQSIVIDAAAPAVSLITPTNGSVASSTISLSASASDVGTGVAGVQFKVGTTNIGSEDTSAPYAASWDSTAVADGSYTLSAVVRDVAGNYATSSATITVDNTAPATPGTPNLSTAYDTGVSSTDDITSLNYPQFTSSCQSGNTVTFYVGTTSPSELLGSVTCAVTNFATRNTSSFSAGSYTIIAVQSDAVGNTSASSSALSFVIDLTAPSVAFTTPANLDTASGTISLAATASDAGTGITGVQFKVGTTNIGSEDTTSPYGTSLDTTTLSDGSYTLNAVARDVAGNYATSSISITVDNTAPVAPGTPDLTTGTDTGDSSTDDTTSNATPQFTVSCVSGSTVRIFRAGSTQIGSGTCSSSTVTITSSALAEGSHTITAKQTDIVGNTSSASTGLSISVDTTGPSVSFTSPLNGSTTAGTISVDATATDSLTSVSGVLFSYGATVIGSEDTSSPYSVSLDTTTLTDGAYTLNAVARDAVGNYSTSTISMTVANTVATTTTSTSAGPTQSSGPTAYSSAPTVAIPGIYNPAGNNGSADVVSPTKAIASAIVQSAGIAPNFNFTQNATVRTINNEVINIQRMLNTMGYTVATTGVGSKGNESLFFGPKTRLALIRFQRAFAIPTTGFFGPLSRAAMNRILNSVR